MRTIDREVVCVVLVSKDGKLFQALQTPRGGGVYAGYWAIIGGGVEDGESQRAALNREHFEETGIDISKYDAELVHESQDEREKTLKDSGERVHCKMKFFIYRVIINDHNANEIEVRLDDEHSKFRFVDPSELKDMKIAPTSIDLFKKLGYL